MVAKIEIAETVVSSLEDHAEIQASRICARGRGFESSEEALRDQRGTQQRGRRKV